MGEGAKELALLEELIKIPSYVDVAHDENLAVDFLETYLKGHFPGMSLTRMPVKGTSRANIYLKGSKPTKLLFVGHIDTVPPSDGWTTAPLEPTIHDGNLYGLGAADMKGGLASLLIALQEIDQSLLETIAVLIYIDEEYHFVGMQQVVKESLFVDKEPELVISLDGGMDIMSGCRGLIKIDLELLGKSGHASNPDNGTNVITRSMDAFAALESKLSEFKDDTLGRSTMNVAYMRAGAVEDVNDPTIMQTVGNVIPNYADVIIELRPATPLLNGERVRRILEQELTNRSVHIKRIDVQHDLHAWPGSFKDKAMTDFLHTCYDEAKVAWHPVDPQYRGFIDVQMLAETISTPTYVIGAGGNNLHGADEHIPLENLGTVKNLYKIVINKFLKEK